MIKALALTLAATCAPGATEAQGESPCAARAQLAERLAKKYQESQAGAGLQSTSRIIEVWASLDGTWTIIATDPRGVSCILASGTHWRRIAPPVPGEQG